MIDHTDIVRVPSDTDIVYEPFFEYTDTDWISPHDAEYSMANGLTGGVYRRLSPEQGGAVDTVLEKIADYMDDELEHTLSGLTSLIEPLLIIFLGVMIGGMVLAMFLPVFDLVNQVR